ncbi:pyruvate kinase [Caulobacter ginsengisoli]|uniref:Pyruvate kinase n=1 Tax=Caulobacter ginsengisoli TaxID=400775 RepID=A0ABU0IXY6_9CAUL|nr:pyruvate kinase [Caulobacter ginsengisoli]MDQ0466869.1 pyruvate kinase [Caulobacter ginsengisoli]
MPVSLDVPRRRRRTKIVATLGPASSDKAMIRELFVAGVDVFRLNFSHGDHADHADRLKLIREIEAESGRPIGVLADVQGPKLRVGRFSGGHVDLRAGTEFRLDLISTPGDARRVELQHPEIIEAAGIGTQLLLDDGRIRLEVVRKGADRLETKVLTGGRLSDRKGVNVPGVLLPIPALTVKDLADLAFALEQGVDYIGLSFVQRRADVEQARSIVGDKAWILTKVEKPQALDDLEGIVALSDAVMVARGDLGVELPPEDVPMAQKRIIRCARRLAKPVIVATQMLESMITSPAPTRAEATDVAAAVLDGTDAVMLSAETAAGQYPIEAVRMMDRIIARVERDEEWRTANAASRPEPEHTSAGAIAAAARQVAATIGAQAIGAFSQSGSTALRIARERPEAPVMGFTPVLETARRLALVWGVHAMQVGEVHSMTETVAKATSLARREGFAGRGEEIVVVAGVPFGQPGTTNALRVATVGGR